LGRLAGGLVAALLVGVLVVGSGVRAQDKGKPQPERIPKRVMQTLKAKFPKAQIQKWAKEKEDAVVVYDFEFTQDGRKFEADIRENGTILNWEKQISAKDLPEAIRKAVSKRYPKAALKEIMQITAVKAGKSTLEGYEIVLRTADKRQVEVTVAPNGKVLEDSGEADTRGKK